MLQNAPIKSKHQRLNRSSMAFFFALLLPSQQRLHCPYLRNSICTAARTLLPQLQINDEHQLDVTRGLWPRGVQWRGARVKRIGPSFAGWGSSGFPHTRASLYSCIIRTSGINESGRTASSISRKFPSSICHDWHTAVTTAWIAFDASAAPSSSPLYAPTPTLKRISI